MRKVAWKGWRTELDPRQFFSLNDWLFFTVAWPIMLEGLEVVAMNLTPIWPRPLLRDMSWNWLNPWATGCPKLGPSTTDFTHDYCYGTNAGHFGGPYSILWYWSMYILAAGGKYYPYINDLTIFVIINWIIVWRLRRAFPGYGWLAVVNTFYSWTAWMFLLAWPQILLMLYTTTASMLFKNRYVRLFFLVLGPFLRFPIPGPLYLWRFIFGFSLQVWGNLPPYLATIFFWGLAFGRLVKGWNKTDKKMKATAHMPSQRIHGSE